MKTDLERLTLTVALAPFAALDIHHLRDKPDDREVWQLNETTITVGDIRRAKRALGRDGMNENEPVVLKLTGAEWVAVLLALRTTPVGRIPIIVESLQGQLDEITKPVDETA